MNKKAVKVVKGDAVVDKIVDMRRKCFTIKEIAKCIRKRDRFVSKVLSKVTAGKEMGIAAVKKLYSSGIGIKAIAKRLKISDKIVSRVVHKHFRKSQKKCAKK